MNQELKDLIISNITKIKKAKEVIHYGLQFQGSVNAGFIKPENFIRMVQVDSGNAEFKVERDWTQFEDAFKNDFAVMAKISIISFQIIVVKESYASLFVQGNKHGLTWANQFNNPDLYSAQQILKCIRDAMGHFKAPLSALDAFGYWNFKKQQFGKLEVKGINVVLDTTNLHDKPFSWNDIGGMKNFIKILDYLENDLSMKLKVNFILVP